MDDMIEALRKLADRFDAISKEEDYGLCMDWIADVYGIAATEITHILDAYAPEICVE